MKQAAALLIIILTLPGCSLLRHSTEDRQTQTERTERRDINTDVFEQIEITIPPAVYAALLDTRPLPAPDRTDTTAARPRVIPPDTPPVRISIDRTEKRTERREADEQTEVQEKSENIRETRGTGLFGFWGGAALALAGVVVVFILLRRARVL